MKTKALILGLSLLFSVSAFSQAIPKVNKRQATQKARIVEGVATGDLTKKETKQLAKQQKRINRLERRAKSDGVVTPKERARITKAQNKANRNIKRKKNN